MKTLKIKKAQVIKALRTEPLEKGNWIDISPKDYEQFERSPLLVASAFDCKVCAVGAVLRSTGLTPMEILRVGGNLSLSYGYNVFRDARHGDIDNLLIKGNYLGALSCYFESTIPLRGSYGLKHRERLVQFVEKNFPGYIEVSV